MSGTPAVIVRIDCRVVRPDSQLVRQLACATALRPAAAVAYLVSCKAFFAVMIVGYMLTRTFCGRLLLPAAFLAAMAPAAVAAREQPLRPWTGKTPALKLADTGGNQWDLASLRGKVVVLNFWAGWCGPCVDELPVLNELASGAATRDKLVVLGVNYKEGADAIERFMGQHPFAYPVLRDKTGDAFKQWTSGVMPTTILIDQTGRARWRLVGEIDAGSPALRRAIDDLLKQ
jgi:cytochrome c biogenesis protein CcmG/thiol:disulfide interchange protein DsbE